MGPCRRGRDPAARGVSAGCIGAACPRVLAKPAGVSTFPVPRCLRVALFGVGGTRWECDLTDRGGPCSGAAPAAAHPHPEPGCAWVPALQVGFLAGSSSILLTTSPASLEAFKLVLPVAAAWSSESLRCWTVCTAAPQQPSVGFGAALHQSTAPQFPASPSSAAAGPSTGGAEPGPGHEAGGQWGGQPIPCLLRITKCRAEDRDAGRRCPTGGGAVVAPQRLSQRGWRGALGNAPVSS